MKQFATCCTATRRLGTIAIMIGSVLFPFAARGQTTANLSTPKITSVSPIWATQKQTITILGRGFGTMIPYNGNSNFIMLSDITQNWNAGHPPDLVNLIVAEWTDSRIVLQGLSGAYGGGWSLSADDVLVIRVWNAQSGAGPASFTVKVRADEPAVRPVIAEPLRQKTGASIVRAVIQGGSTSLDLPLGQMYLYGMTTGGGAPSSAFTVGQYAQVENAAGKPSGALAYGTNKQNSYSTQTAYHDIAGVSIAGSWEHFAAYNGSNPESGAHDASVSFETGEDSLVVILGLASSQQFVSVEGIPELHVDAYRTGGGIVIAHAYVKPGTYTVVEHSKVLAAGQAPPHMADLIGVFVFGGRQAEKQPAAVSEQRHVATIRSVDFLNFEYPSDCWEQFNGFDKIIHLSNGEWNKDDVGSFMIRKKDSKWMMTYGDVDRDGQDEAVIVTSCQGQTNFDFEEVFVFALASAGPKLVARLSPSDWGKGEEGNGSYFPVTSVLASDRQLAVSFLAGGSHACPAWTVTARFQWNGSGLAHTGVDRKPFNCQTQ